MNCPFSLVARTSRHQSPCLGVSSLRPCSGVPSTCACMWGGEGNPDLLPASSSSNRTDNPQVPTSRFSSRASPRCCRPTIAPACPRGKPWPQSCTQTPPSKLWHRSCYHSHFTMRQLRPTEVQGLVRGPRKCQSWGCSPDLPPTPQLADATAFLCPLFLCKPSRTFPHLCFFPSSCTAGPDGPRPAQRAVDLSSSPPGPTTCINVSQSHISFSSNQTPVYSH